MSNYTCIFSTSTRRCSDYKPDWHTLLASYDLVNMVTQYLIYFPHSKCECHVMLLWKYIPALNHQYWQVICCTALIGSKECELIPTSVVLVGHEVVITQDPGSLANLYNNNNLWSRVLDRGFMGTSLAEITWVTINVYNGGTHVTHVSIVNLIDHSLYHWLQIYLIQNCESKQFIYD